ncbi:aminopeptidase P family protein [bacterium]|nr:aminopeptidase P family protein [bacterium]
MGAARRLAADAGVDALLVWNLANVRWLSGFTGTEASIVIGRDKAFFLTDGRYETQAADEAPDFERRISFDKIALIEKALSECGARRVGFEDETITVGRLAALRDAAGDVEFVRLGDKVDGLRLRKDAREIAIMRRAAWAAEVGFEAAKAALRPGVSESEIALVLETAMRRAGATRPSFDTIVASGGRGALPHGVASGKIIAEGELVVIDFGCVVDGYCSDQTMTIGVGEVEPEARRVYEIVRVAQQAAIDAIRPGVLLRDVDRVARESIAAAGFGDKFTHGLGHGVGIEIHEGPRLTSRSEAVAEPGMVVTVEPGVYLPGRFGVRIEDTVVITESGCDRLTTLDKNYTRV